MDTLNNESGILCITGSIAVQQQLSVAFSKDSKLIHPREGIFQSPTYCKKLLDGLQVILFEWERSLRGVFMRIEQWRDSSSTALLALCNGESSGHVVALYLGADGIIPLPFSRPFFDEKIRTIGLRNSGPMDEAAGQPGLFHQQRHIPDKLHSSQPEPLLIELDLGAHRCIAGMNGSVREIVLTALEFKVLRLFVEHRDKCLSREDLLHNAWGVDYETGTNVVDTLISGLRTKLRSSGAADLIETVRGVGYRLSDGGTIKIITS